MESSLGQFVGEVFNSWVEKLGIVFTLLPLIEKVPRIKSSLKNRPVLEVVGSLLWVLALVCVFWGFYSAWLTHYNAEKDLQGKLSDLTTPQLKLQIDELAVGETTKEPTLINVPGVFLIASLTNEGAPSVADNWSLEIVFLDGHSSGRLPAEYLDPKRTVSGRQSQTRQPWKMPNDPLYEKASKPIERGSRVRGTMVFIGQSLSLNKMKEPGTRYVLRCLDVHGKEVRGDDLYNPGNSLQNPVYFPGLGALPPQK